MAQRRGGGGAAAEKPVTVIEQTRMENGNTACRDKRQGL